MKNKILSAVILTVFIVPLFVAPSGTFAQTQKNRPPVISGISSPTVLTTDQVGTWSVSAYDPENGNLSYSVDWGDTAHPLALAKLQPDFVQTATFSHSYDAPGTYQVQFTVRDDAGLTAKSSVTVHVKAGATTLSISNLVATSTKQNHATVTWNTNLRSDSMVWISTTSPIDTSKNPSITRKGPTTKHKIELNKLTPDTTYFVVVKSNVKDGSVLSSEISFKTPALPSLAPVITSVDGPQSLITDEQGTWTLNALDPKNTQLSYSVDWGDTAMAGMRTLLMKEPAFTQTSTFTHVYAEPGTYHILFTVKNEAGMTAAASANVNVTQATSTDMTPPVLSNIAISNIGSDKAIVSWNTDESADSSVWFDTNQNVNTIVTPAVFNGATTATHSLDLTGLNASTTYYVVVGSSDADGNMSTSSPISFTTAPIVATTTIPVISNVTSQATTTAITVNWSTDVATDSTVYYSTTTPVVIGAVGTASVTDPNLANSHSLTLNGLTASTTYYFLIQSKDSIGTTATTSEHSLATTSM
ncbi:MAG: fibronectin type III domain-containing protein [Candidatus Pacebacteria bacterium]|nr:fibronectin type III domain-containing protein [Candidatus Paceibacterota bacterium]